ncbi:kinase-like domain-containing protein [Syncephalis fuscata]|nr:kinase-like domain-containing protein [Syncephalis fuscata]
MPGREVTVSIRVIKSLTPVQVEDSLEYEEKINARFMITDKSIGKGALGKVYLGFDRSTGRRAAVKISKKERGIDAFNHEVSVLRRVGNHSNVIKLLDDKITALNTYLFLEYAAGGDLIDYIISKSALPEMEAKHIFKQLLEGIEYLHSKDVVHYDIKPDNVLLLDGQECPRVVFADFGMARPLLSSPTVTAAYGTVSYMAPEVLLGSDAREKMFAIINSTPGAASQLPSALLDAKGYGKPADMWSLGATLHTMLLGNWPYGSTNNQSVYMRTILQHSPTFGQEKANGPSKQAVQLMKRLLDLDSGTRYTAKQALDSSWFDDEKEQIDAAIPFDATSPSQEEPAVSTTPITPTVTPTTPPAPAAAIIQAPAKKKQRQSALKLPLRVQPHRQARLGKKYYK